jgi:hypothetical protein
MPKALEHLILTTETIGSHIKPTELHLQSTSLKTHVEAQTFFYSVTLDLLFV